MTHFRYLLFVLVLPLITFGQKVTIDRSYEKGVSVNGYKSGVWSYYEDGVLKLKVDYSTGKLVYLAKDTSRYAIKTVDGWKWSRLDIYPHYLGSMDELIEIMARNMRYPQKARDKLVRGAVLLSFEINKQGKADSAKIIRNIGKGCGEEVLRVFHLFPNFWLVANKGGKQYKSRYVLPVLFRIKSDGVWRKGSRHEKEELEQVKASVNPSKYLQELVISAL